jgi:hypothetical protein
MIKDTVNIRLLDKPLIIGYEYDNEDPVIGSGDSDRPGCITLNIVSIDASDEDWLVLLDSYKYTIDLLNDIKESVLKSL